MGNNLAELENEVQNKIVELNHKIHDDNYAFRRNHQSYEYSSYINHAIAFYYAANCECVDLFINRAEKFLEQNSECVHSEYLMLSKECLSLFKQILTYEK